MQSIDNKLIDQKEISELSGKNGHSIQHENKCFDIGTVDCFFHHYTFENPWKQENFFWKNYLNPQEKEKLNLSKYNYFILMSSSGCAPVFHHLFKNFIWKKIFHY